MQTEKFNAQEILDYLAQRPPFLMIDRIDSLVPGKECTAVKNITWTESCFMGHFPGNPAFPGVLSLEAMAQTCCALLVHQDKNAVPLLAGVNEARFSNVVRPGDQMVIHAVLINQFKGIFSEFDVEAKVDENTVVKCKITLAVKK